MRQKIAMTAGTFMIAGGLLGASLTFSPMEDVSAQETEPPTEERSETHEQMHNMMDGMMGEGFTERMHAQMPGSEEMMEACASGMDGMMNGGMMNGMDGMMNGGMMNGMDGMMNGGDNMNQTPPTNENQREDQ